jgi:hypothetical protein
MAKPKRKTITFRPTSSTDAQLRASASKNHRSINEEIELHIRRSFEQANLLGAVREEIRQALSGPRATAVMPVGNTPWWAQTKAQQ